MAGGVATNEIILNKNKIMSWKFLSSSVDGSSFVIDNIDVWKYDWVDTGDRVIVKDPEYGKDFNFIIWEIIKEPDKIKFAAGEFSDGVWGFYVKS